MADHAKGQYVVIHDFAFKSVESINPLSTTSHLTPFLIGSYYASRTCVANHDKAKKMLYYKLFT